MNQSAKFWGRDFQERHPSPKGQDPDSPDSPAGMAAMLDMRNHMKSSTGTGQQAELAPSSISATGLPKLESMLVVKFDWKRRQWVTTYCNQGFVKVMQLYEEDVIKKPWKDVLCGR